MPFLLAEILNFQGAKPCLGVGSFSKTIDKITLIIKMIVVALQKLIFFMVFSPVISVLYLVGNIMENSEPLPGSETTLI